MPSSPYTNLSNDTNAKSWCRVGVDRGLSWPKAISDRRPRDAGFVLGTLQSKFKRQFGRSLGLLIALGSIDDGEPADFLRTRIDPDQDVISGFNSLVRCARRAL